MISTPLKRPRHHIFKIGIAKHTLGFKNRSHSIRVRRIDCNIKGYAALAYGLAQEDIERGYHVHAEL